MYIVYLFKEKLTNKIIYVGSTSRPIVRLKEHKQALNGIKNRQKIHTYMINNNLKLYDDVIVEFVKECENKQEMLNEEEKLFYKYKDTLLNERPAENRKGQYNSTAKKVKCITDGNVFKSILQCSKFYHKSRSTISDCLNGRQNHIVINKRFYEFSYL